MGGASRENYRITINPKALLRWRTWRYGYSRRLVFIDNFAWMVCAVIGHRPYNTGGIYEPIEHACARCYRWLKHLDPPVQPPQMPYFSNAKVPPKNHEDVNG